LEKSPIEQRYSMLSVAHWFSFSNPPLTAERKPQVVEKQTLAALFVS
jgi:hypothetical protein